jgi:hypothetical protein
MIKIEAYTDSVVRQFYNGLVMKQKNGIRFAYEIRMDHEQIIPRSTDLAGFFAFQDYIFSTTESIEIWVYKGNSRRYDKYVFEFSPKNTAPPVDIEALLAEERQKMQKAWEHQQLVRELKDSKEKCKDLKEDNRQFKERIQQLEAEAKNANVVQELMGVLKHSSLLDKFSGNTSKVLNDVGTAKEPVLLNGILGKELLDILHEIQHDLGEEQFLFFLGTALMLGKHPAVIQEVRKLIEQTITTPNNIPHNETR